MIMLDGIPRMVLVLIGCGRPEDLAFVYGRD